MSEAKRRCTLHEFRQWQAYSTVEPFGVEREDFRTAIIAATVSQSMSGKRAVFGDFMASAYLDKKPQRSVAELAESFRQFASQHNSRNSK